MRTVLFFDSFCLNQWENLRRRVGRPELVPAMPLANVCVTVSRFAQVMTVEPLVGMSAGTSSVAYSVFHLSPCLLG